MRFRKALQLRQDAFEFFEYVRRDVRILYDVLDGYARLYERRKGLDGYDGPVQTVTAF